MKYKIGIVQKNATQFDGPLFRFLEKNATFDLNVYYTHPNGDKSYNDRELEMVAKWDIDVLFGYNSYTRKHTIGWLKDLVSKIQQDKNDLTIISGYVPISHLLIALYLTLRGKAVGLRSDSILSYEAVGGFKKKLKGFILPKIFSVYRTVHPVGTLASEYLKQYGIKNESHFIFPYSIDNDWFNGRIVTEGEKYKEIKNELNIPFHSRVLIGILKFVDREDPLTLMNAFCRLHERYPDLHLILIGDGPLRLPLENIVKTHNLNPYVHLPGFLPYSQLPKFFAVSDVFVHPAIRESWGVSVNEAMVAGVPVVVSNMVGSGADLIIEGQTGMIFTAGDELSLESKIDNLLTSDTKRASIALNASETIKLWSYKRTQIELEKALNYIEKNKKL